MAERPSPLSIAIGTLILLHSDPTSPYYEITDRENDEDDRLSAFLHSLTTTTKTITTRSHENNFVETERLVSFGQRLQDATSLSTRDCCFFYISLAAKSLDGLHSLMESFQISIADAVILDPDSSRGIFLRKLCLGFDQLSFEATTALFQCLREELEETMTRMMIVPENNRKTTVSAMIKWPKSAQQLDAVLRQTCLEHHQQETTFEATELQIRQVLEQNPGLPSAYFMRFLNCMQYGEKNGALEALHQYFDSAIIQERRKDGERFVLRHDMLQYAAILLAAVYHSFGDDDLSLAATDEAVRVAQQSRDGPCVAYALGWLFQNHRLGEEEDVAAAATAQDLLRRCSHRATEDHLRSLVAGANLSLAQYIAQHLHQHRPNNNNNSSNNNYMPAAAAWSALLDASTETSPATSNAGLSSFDRPTHITDLRQSSDAMQILVHQWMVSAGIWDSYGHTALSGLYSYLPLHFHDTCLLSESDLAMTIQNVAQAALFGSSSLAVTVDTSDLYQQLEREEPLGGDVPCIYGKALAKLLGLLGKYNLPMSKLAKHGIALILHEWAVRRNDLDDAVALMRALESYLHPRMPHYHESVLDTLAQKSWLLSRQGNWDEAKCLLKKLVAVCQQQGLRSRQARLLVQLSWMQFESASHHNFTAALPPLLECLSLCEKLHLDSIHATALTILAKVHLRLFNSKRAMALLKAALPLLLQNEHVWYQAEAYLTFAKCYLQRAKNVVQTGSGKERIRRLLRTALNLLEQSTRLFEQCQDLIRLREALYLQARLYHALQPEETTMMDQRDKMAQRFVDVSRYLQGSRSCLSLNRKHTCCILNVLHQPLALRHVALRPVPVIR
jgi:tetratricopeptide (TPR) repeat protein